MLRPIQNFGVETVVWDLIMCSILDSIRMVESSARSESNEQVRLSVHRMVWTAYWNVIYRTVYLGGWDA